MTLCNHELLSSLLILIHPQPKLILNQKQSPSTCLLLSWNNMQITPDTRTPNLILQIGTPRSNSPEKRSTPADIVWENAAAYAGHSPNGVQLFRVKLRPQANRQPGQSNDSFRLNESVRERAMLTGSTHLTKSYFMSLDCRLVLFFISLRCC